MKTLKDVDPSEYDFLDFGAGDGASLRRCEERFGGRGLGIDINERKISAAQRRGEDIVFGDILTLPRQPLVRYVSMDNFLEHLPDYGLVRRMLEVATAVAAEFVYIRHPSFEDESYLRALGLKQYWHDWRGHPSHLLLSELLDMLRSTGAGPFDIEYAYPVLDSSDPSILPIHAPPDQHDYDESLHGEKPSVDFSKPVHRQVRVIAYVRGGTESPRIESDAGSSEVDEAETTELRALLSASEQRRIQEVSTLQAQLDDLKSRRAIQLSNGLWRLRNAKNGRDRKSALRDLRKALRPE